MAVYKYCKRQFAEQMVEQGGLMIRDVAEYRQTDKFGEYAGDQLDGSKHLSGHIHGLSHENIDKYPGLQGIVHVGPGAKIDSASFGEIIVDSPSLHVFCVSTEYSETTHRIWFEEMGYDACYRIESPRLFSRAVADALNGMGHRVTWKEHGPIVYAKTIDVASQLAGQHPAWIKRHTDHLPQAEYRFGWEVKIDRAELVIPESRAFNYCKVHAILKI